MIGTLDSRTNEPVSIYWIIIRHIVNKLQIMLNRYPITLILNILIILNTQQKIKTNRKNILIVSQCTQTVCAFVAVVSKQLME